MLSSGHDRSAGSSSKPDCSAEQQLNALTQLVATAWLFFSSSGVDSELLCAPISRSATRSQARKFCRVHNTKSAGRVASLSRDSIPRGMR